MRVILASNNQHKLEEIYDILKDFDYELVSMRDAGLDMDIEENGTTFEENSMIKAKAVVNELNCIAIADDSGLMVDALDGAPGIYSARYAGEPSDSEKNNQKLLKALENETNRKAKFVSVITMLFPNGDSIVARGEAHGDIGHAYLGDNGFGYDPLFIDENSKKSFAQLTSDEKNSISHRAKALVILREKLQEAK